MIFLSKREIGIFPINFARSSHPTLKKTFSFFDFDKIATSLFRSLKVPCFEREAVWVMKSYCLSLRAIDKVVHELEHTPLKNPISIKMMEIFMVLDR